MFRRIIPLVALFLAAGSAGAAEIGKDKDDTPIFDNLDEVLRGKAAEILKYAKSKGYGNVGVLKFLVKKGDAAASDNVGELNNSLANRLEVALVLSNPDEDLGIIQHASRTVVKENNVRASHLTPEGRKAFFTGEYDLAWGPRKVSADAFVTGVATISKDLKRTTLKFQVFGKDGVIAEPFDDVVMETSPRVLTEAGYSYLIKPDVAKEAVAAAKKDKGNRFPRATLVEKAVDPLEGTLAFADTSKVSPFRDGAVKLTILYNGVPQAIEKGVVPEPKEGDKVSFVLENPTADTYAVVLKINGVNTLFSETLNDPRMCHKWILKPGQKQTVAGFQVDDKNVNAFKVLSPQESEENEVNYGDNAGTFRMIVFKGSVTKEDPSVEQNHQLGESQVARAAIGRGTLDVGDISAGSLNALKRTLRGREKAGEGARGMVVAGGPQGMKEVERLFFKPEFADPVHDVTIRYYVPKRK